MALEVTLGTQDPQTWKLSLSEDTHAYSSFNGLFSWRPTSHPRKYTYISKVLTSEVLIVSHVCFWLGGIPPNREITLENRLRFPEDLRNLHVPLAISEHWACRINLLGWEAVAWLFLAQLNSNLNIDSSPYNLLFYKEGLISPSPMHSEVSRRSKDNCIHYFQPQLLVQKGIQFQLIISRAPASSVSIRRHAAFLPRGTESEHPNCLSWVLPLTATSLPGTTLDFTGQTPHLPNWRTSSVLKWLSDILRQRSSPCWLAFVYATFHSYHRNLSIPQIKPWCPSRIELGCSSHCLKHLPAAVNPWLWMKRRKWRNLGQL